MNLFCHSNKNKKRNRSLSNCIFYAWKEDMFSVKNGMGNIIYWNAPTNRICTFVSFTFHLLVSFSCFIEPPPLVLMHGGFLCITICLCTKFRQELGGRYLRKMLLGQHVISYIFCFKIQAGGLSSSSSCFILTFMLYWKWRIKYIIEDLKYFYFNKKNATYHA